MNRVLIFVLTFVACACYAGPSSDALDAFAWERCYGHSETGGFAAAANVLEVSAYEQLRSLGEITGPAAAVDSFEEIAEGDEQLRDVLNEWVLQTQHELTEVDGFVDARYYVSLRERLGAAAAKRLAATFVKLCYSQQNDPERVTVEARDQHFAYDQVTSVLLSFDEGDEAVQALSEFRYHRFVFLQAYDAVVAGDEVALALATLRLLPELEMDAELSYANEAQQLFVKRAQIRNRQALAVFTLAKAGVKGFEMSQAIYLFEGALATYKRVDLAAQPEVARLHANCVHNLLWVLLRHGDTANFTRAIELVTELRNYVETAVEDDSDSFRRFAQTLEMYAIASAA